VPVHYTSYMNTTNTRKTNSVTVGFSIPKTEQSRLDHLVEVFSGGNRSAFLRMAMDRMEAADRAQRLRSIQTYGARRSTELGISPDAISDRVKRVLARRAEA
jgi:Arc/MetJ-type ribon-helix-helix transcriptional regulator